MAHSRGAAAPATTAAPRFGVVGRGSRVASQPQAQRQSQRLSRHRQPPPSSLLQGASHVPDLDGRKCPVLNEAASRVHAANVRAARTGPSPRYRYTGRPLRPTPTLHLLRRAFGRLLRRRARAPPAALRPGTRGLRTGRRSPARAGGRARRPHPRPRRGGDHGGRPATCAASTRIYRRAVAAIDARRPDVAVLVDYPDVNLRFARELRARGVSVVYYVSPQIWAWKKGRIHTIRETVARMLVIFPFEEEIYRRAGVSVRFVGHPLVDAVRPMARPRERTSCASAASIPARPVIALLPGSRGSGDRPQPAAARGRGRAPLGEAARSAIPAGAGSRPRRRPLRKTARGHSGAARPAAGATTWSGSAAVALVASGTATVETALLGTPMVVVYRLSPLTYLLGRPFVSVPHYAMPNLVAGRRVVPEIIQWDFTPERVAGGRRSRFSRMNGPRRCGRTWPRCANASAGPAPRPGRRRRSRRFGWVHEKRVDQSLVICHLLMSFLIER